MQKLEKRETSRIHKHISTMLESIAKNLSKYSTFPRKKKIIITPSSEITAFTFTCIRRKFHCHFKNPLFFLQLIQNVTHPDATHIHDPFTPLTLIEYCAHELRRWQYFFCLPKPEAASLSREFSVSSSTPHGCPI